MLAQDFFSITPSLEPMSPGIIILQCSGSGRFLSWQSSADIIGCYQKPGLTLNALEEEQKAPPTEVPQTPFNT